MKKLAALGGFIAVFIPLILGFFQYRQSVQQNFDQNFRAVVDKLSSANKEERLAAASNLGTFIREGRHSQATEDILANKLSVELDYNVLNGIRGSLQRANKKKYGDLIQKFLDIDRNIFTYKYPLSQWKGQALTIFNEIDSISFEREKLLKKTQSAVDSAQLAILKEEMKRKWEIFYQIEKDFNEISMHKDVIANFVTVFLGVSRNYPIKGLEFYQNSLNSVVMMELDLRGSRFKHSSLSNSTILYTKFDESDILGTVFTFSDLTHSQFVNCRIFSTLFDQSTFENADFSGSEFKDVFFTGSDLEGAKFTKAKGLKPIYFYKAENVDSAIFDPKFKKELDEKLSSISESDFIDYVKNKSILDDQRIRELFKTLKELKEESTIKDRTYTFLDLTNSNFARYKISASLFDQATLKHVNFTGSEFKDVFFTGSDLEGAKFTKCKGLKPIYFYKAKNINKGLFDLEFRIELGKELGKMTEEQFKEYVENQSILSKQRMLDLFITLDELKGKK